jgi:hypothetical protein
MVVTFEYYEKEFVDYFWAIYPEYLHLRSHTNVFSESILGISHPIIGHT